MRHRQMVPGDGVPAADRHARARAAMVALLRARGVGDPAVLAAMSAVPRHRFVDPAQSDAAYADTPLPIGHGQTISQPEMVAVMLEALGLTGDEHVLEVGTGSGYQAALLGQLARDVVTVEIVPELAARAREALAATGADNVRVHLGDGSLGWPAGAPYDAIVVAAAAPRVPAPLVDQLADGGRLVLPVAQSLTRVTRHGDAVDEVRLGGCAFVPLVGAQGWIAGGDGPTWSHFEHGADVGIRGRGATVAEAFEAAALALTAVLVPPAEVVPREEVAFACEAPDQDTLLYDFLSQVVYEMATRGMVFGRYQVEVEGPRLTARAFGEPVDRLRHRPTVEVKGPTYTELRVTEDDAGVTAQCVVDV